MQTHGGLISTAAQIIELANVLSEKEVIAFDTEFIRENTFFPIVEIIQVATDEDSWLVDAQAFKRGNRPGPQGGFDAGIKPLLAVFQNPKILKIVHAAQGDQECLYTSFGIVAEPILDTAAAASLCGYGDNVGLGKLLKSVLDVTIKKGHARTNWSVRPLPEQLLEYAHADVVHLVELARVLLDRLEKEGRKNWALELSSRFNDPALYESDPEAIAQKLARGGRMDRKGFAALLELVKWREKRVRQLNLPRRWVADDTVLIDLAQVRPSDLEHLGTFRGLNKGEIKASGEAILEALKRASAVVTTAEPPRSARVEAPSPEELQVLELLKCYIGILAEKLRIAPKHISTVAQMIPLLRSQVENPEDLVRAGILGEEAARLIGQDLIEFLNGKRGLSVKKPSHENQKLGIEVIQL